MICHSVFMKDSTLVFCTEKPYSSLLFQVLYTIINPKAVTMGQLYGSFDPVSHEWSDGKFILDYPTTDERFWLPQHEAKVASACPQSKMADRWTS
jgi:hypothetical protein